MVDLCKFSPSELRSALSLNFDLPESRDQNQALEIFFHHLSKLFSWSSCMFFGLDPIITQPLPSNHFAMNIDNSAKEMEEYAQHYFAIDPLLHLVLPANQNRVRRTEDVIAPRNYLNTEYYTDFKRPQRIETSMAFCGGVENRPLFALAMHLDRPGATFTDRQRDLFQLLIPGLTRTIHALEFRRIYASSTETHELAMWVLNGRGEILQCNELAEAYTEELHLAGADLFPEEITRLVQSVRASPSKIPQVKQVLFPSYRPRLRFTLITNTKQQRRSDEAYITLLAEILDGDDALHAKMSALRLTGREQEIAVLVIQGQSYRSIAEQLGIQEQTVRDHLRSIFRKTEVNKRSALVALLLNR